MATAKAKKATDASPEKRCRGRPPVRSETESLQMLVQAASVEFQENGFAAASMNAIAQRSGLSTRTIYQLVPTKAELFELVVTDRTGGFVLELDGGADDGFAAVEGLTRIMTAYGNLTLSPETLALTRLVIAEGERFPEIAGTFYTKAIQRTSIAIEAWLTRHVQKGVIKLADPKLAASMLRGMMIMDLQRAVFLGKAKPPTAKAIAERAAACAEAFIEGCRA